MWVDSEVGKGAKFFVELPIASCEEESLMTPAVVEKPALDPDAAKRRVLIIDDEPGIVNVLKEALGGSGYMIETATDGAVALQQISMTHYDAIVSDMRMPNMDGRALYEAVKNTKPEMAGNIIFVTGDAANSDSYGFLELTGNRWVKKPFNIAEVEWAVDCVVRQGAMN